MNRSPSAILLYHFLHPDDVVASQLWTTLATHLHTHGWNISAYPSNRSCHSESTFPSHDHFEGIDIHRIWRPGLSQSSGIGRILNAAWMITAWSLLALTHKPDVLLIGTDPILSVLAIPAWRIFSRKTRIVHWCFDLYPEAAVADGLLPANSLLTRFLTALARRAYRSCDLIVDLGPCMRQRLDAYQHNAQTATLTPWALQESATPVPQDPQERQELFGNAKLGLLYSGSFGRAHIFEPFLALARAARHLDIQTTFSIRGNRLASLRAAVHPDDTNIRIVDFAPPDRLETRLAAADIHLVSLHEDWTGAVVPSKFFGALAVGRPVLFAGSPDSAIAHFIRQYQVGWVLGNDPADILKDLEALIDDPARRDALSAHCTKIYLENFSKEIMCTAWDRHLKALISQ